MPPTSLGCCVIQSLNQIGEKLKYVNKDDRFVLSRKGSQFNLYSYREQDDDLLDDFRKSDVFLVTLQVDGKYLSFDEKTGSAVGIEIEPESRIPRNAIFRYVKQKFDALSVSICTLYDDKERWLRHNNSKLRVSHSFMRSYL